METNLKYIFGERRALKEDVEETRTIEFVISTDKKDRHGTRLLVDRWDLENFNRNGIVGYQHNVYGSWFSDPNPDDVIGVGRAWVEDGKLIGSIKFEPEEINPLAEKLFRKVQHGTIKSTSVGFVETKEGDFGQGEEARGKENQTYYYGAQELLEFSLVNIPSNTDAVKRNLNPAQKDLIKEIVKEMTAEKEEEKKPDLEGITETQKREMRLKLLKLT